MTAVVVSVQGSAEEYLAPERAVVSLQVGLEGRDKAAVIAGTQRGADRVTAEIVALHDPVGGPVTWYSRSGMANSSHRPWNEQGKQLPLVYTAWVRLEVKFADFEALAGWVDRVIALEGVRLQEIDWRLTESTERRASARVRRAAVVAARDKAQAYADSLDLGPVTPVALADVGMLGDRRASGELAGTAVAARRGLGFAKEGGTDVPAMVPEDVRISAAVDATFTTAG